MVDFDHATRIASLSTLLSSWCNFEGISVMVVWQSLPVVGKLDHTMLSGSLVYRVAWWSSSRVSLSLIPNGVPVWPSVLLWKHVEASAGY